MPPTPTPAFSSSLTLPAPSRHQWSRVPAGPGSVRRVPAHPDRTPAGPVGFPAVGMVGGGQLARMTQGAAIALGVRLRVLAESAGAAAAQVVPDAPVGDHRDPDAVAAFA